MKRRNIFSCKHKWGGVEEKEEEEEEQDLMFIKYLSWVDGCTVITVLEVS